MKKSKWFLCILYLFLFNKANSQSFTYDISASALWSHVYRADTDSGPSYHYELNPVFGYQIQAHANQFIGKKELFQVTSSVGFRNYGFEGRHFEQVLHDAPNPDKLFKQFFFFKYKINSAFVSLGGALKKERFRFFTNFQVGYILNVKETRQEVHLSNIFGSEMFFPATNQSATCQDDLSRPFHFDTRFKYHYLDLSFGINYFIQNTRLLLGVKTLLPNKLMTRSDRIGLYDENNPNHTIPYFCDETRWARVCASVIILR